MEKVNACLVSGNMLSVFGNSMVHHKHDLESISIGRKSFTELKYLKIKCRKEFWNFQNVENFLNPRLEKKCISEHPHLTGMGILHYVHVIIPTIVGSTF